MLKRIKTALPLLLCCVWACTPSAHQEEDDGEKQPVFQSFVIEKAHNPALAEDVICRIEGQTIIGVCPGIEYGAPLVPSFSGEFESVIVDGVPQLSGETAVDSRHTLYYHLWSSSGAQTSYKVSLITGNGLPVVSVTTDGTEPVKKDVKISSLVTISNTADKNLEERQATIKVRGNATSGYPKKPFKIKFSAKETPLGYSSNKDWVLLAEYSDKSLLRNAWMFEVSRAVEMKYTPPYEFVELYMNGEYRGVYVFTDQIEDGKNRINIAKDGFIVQNDNALSDVDFYFTTKRKKYNYRFKYPDQDDGDITPEDEDWKYMENYFNTLEEVLYSEDFTNPETGYRAYIEPRSFAKWYLVFELTLNYEPNIYFVMDHKGDKLELYPAWDGEWSLGLAYRPEAYGGWLRYPEGTPKPDDVFWSRGKYLGRLFDDPDFVSLVKEEWAQLKPKLPGVKENIRAAVQRLQYAQDANFKRWPILHSDTHIGVGLIAFDTWKEEVDYTFDVFETRIKTIEAYLQSIQ